MTLSRYGKRRVCFVGVIVKGCYCDRTVNSALAGGYSIRSLQCYSGRRILAIARHFESSEVLGVVFSYVSLMFRLVQ
jgi:hypothetical protein